MRALTPRELECLHWVAVGKTSWEVGVITGLTERTVNFHIARVCAKLNVCRRQAAVAIAVQRGLLPLSSPLSSPLPSQDYAPAMEHDAAKMPPAAHRLGKPPDIHPRAPSAHAATGIQ